jgi:hypothetical protein
VTAKLSRAIVTPHEKREITVANVLHLVEFSNRETLALLRALTARATRGEVVGLALCFQSRAGAEHFVFSGPYNRPANAVNAAVRMKLRLARKQDDLL